MYRGFRDRWERYQAGRQAKLRNDFLPEAMEIVEKPASPLGAAVILIVAAVVLFFGIWAFCGRMDEVVTARGRIVSITGTQVVQTANGGVVREICVKEGDHVEAGQELVILDASAYEIALHNTNRNIELLEYENSLLEQLLAGIMPGADTGEDVEKAEIRKYVLSLREEYESQRKELLSEKKKADLQLTRQNEDLDSIANRRSFLKNQQKILQEAADGENAAEQNAEKTALAIRQKKAQLRDYQELCDAGAVAQAEVDALKDELALLQKEYEIQGQSAVYEDYDNTLRLLEIENQIEQADSEYAAQVQAVEIAREQGAQSLGNLDALRADYEAKLSGMIVENRNSITDRRAEQELQTLDVVEQRIISPVAGTVRTLDVTTQGGVLGAAQQIAAIVPDDGQMMAEIEVLNKDIGYLENHQEAAMKLDTYNFQKYGKLSGRVVNISPDALWSDQKGWVYKVQVAIDSADFAQGASDASVGIGMEGTVEVKVADRAIIDFFLEPVADHFDGSLKVR
ncbi:MAG: HlyD family efflux transporter periplasmic adaptor subunit [Muribaculum sp.]|nr:HlyD family efflux transporter periplasmic adaptor subunit [Muribaculum sp.]